MQIKKFFSPGKLMLTGEYVVFDGVKSLALPTGKYGQQLVVQSVENQDYHTWKSFERGKEWFSMDFSLNLEKILQTTNWGKAVFLLKILQFIKDFKPYLFDFPTSFTTESNFDRNWGWGSSSSLLVLLYKWSGINPFVLNREFFGGSGYDIAVGIENAPIVYQLSSDFKPLVDSIPYCEEKTGPKWEKIENLNYPFSGQLKLVYLNEKQISSEEVKKYKVGLLDEKQKGELNLITEKLLQIREKEEFEQALQRHELILSNLLRSPTIKEILFPDFDGLIKSLGAWGGDFVLASGKNTVNYFKEKGYHIIFDFDKVLI